MAVTATTSCNHLDKTPKRAPGTMDTPPTANEDAGEVHGLEGVFYPEAVIRRNVGEGGSQRISEGLHFVAAKREKRPATGDIGGNAFVFIWAAIRG